MYHIITGKGDTTNHPCAAVSRIYSAEFKEVMNGNIAKNPLKSLVVPME